MLIALLHCTVSSQERAIASTSRRSLGICGVYGGTEGGQIDDKAASVCR